jgi:hypothetical protein
MNIELQAKKIAESYIAKGTDMNGSIAKVASENNLNIEQIKRLVEESNKICFLIKFASTGEQTFEVADYEKVKNILQSDDIIEKKASVEFSKTDYSKNNFYGLEIIDESEKTASENDVLNQAIEKCDFEISTSMNKIAQLKYSFATQDKIDTLEKRAEEYRLIKNHLIEKRAGLISRALNAGAKVSDAALNAGVKAGVNAGAKIGGAALNAGAKVGGTVIKHPIKAGLVPLGVVGSFEEGSKKVAKKSESMIGNNITNLNKEASSMTDVLKEVKPYALIMGAIGLGELAAKQTGGLVGRMKQERDFNTSFQTIEANNEDIRQIPNARAYFDVIARHSPDLAKDPMVAPQLIRQFDMFGGVDVNTIGKLREIQQNSPNNNRNKDENYAGNLLSGIGTFHSIMKDKKPKS